jgi:hypothetical protein
MKRFKLLACKALYREFSLLSSASENFIDATYMQQGLHDTPKLLKEALQREIDMIDEGGDIHSYYPRFGRDFDAIILGYGLCSNGIIGLSSRKYTIVVPRTDDCIALLLGSYRRYKEYFDSHCGTYWYTASWIENAYTPSEEAQKALLAEYTEKYGEDNAKYLAEADTTLKNYNRAAYAEWKELGFPEYEKLARDAAAYFGWDFEKVLGDKKFLEDLINGIWDDRFVIVPPGKRIEADYEGELFKAV